MSAERDPLAGVLADAAALDAVASGCSDSTGDAALDLLVSLRGVINVVTEQVPAGAVALDAELLDLIAAGGAAAGGDPALVLLADLRAAVDQRSAVAASPPTRSRRPDELAARRRTGLPRRAARVAVVAAGIGFAVIGTTGVAAATYSSHPGGTWYSLRAATFGRTDDDPVVDQALVAEIHQQVAAAQATPASAPAHLAVATAAYARLQKIAPLVHDREAARQIEASADAVHVSLTHTRLTVRDGRVLVTGLGVASGQSASGAPAAGAGSTSLDAAKPVPVGTQVPSPGATRGTGGHPSGLAASPVPSISTPAGEVSPSTTGSVSSGTFPAPPASSVSTTSTQPLPSDSTVASAPSSSAPSTTLSASVPASDFPTDATSPSAGVPVTPTPAGSTTAAPTRGAASAATQKPAPIKPKAAKRKKVVTTTATLLSATVPATNASLRPSH